MTTSKPAQYRLAAHRFEEKDGFISTHLSLTGNDKVAIVTASTFAELDAAIDTFGKAHAPCNVWVTCKEARKPRGFDAWNRAKPNRIYRYHDLTENIKAVLLEVFTRQTDGDLGDLHFYTPELWAERGEPVGRNALFTATFEGPLNHLINYGDGQDRNLNPIGQDLDETLAAVGLYYELGFSWSMHIYPKPVPQHATEG